MDYILLAIGAIAIISVLISILAVGLVFIKSDKEENTCIGPTGDTGQKGDTGATGPTGPQGESIDYNASRIFSNYRDVISGTIIPFIPGTFYSVYTGSLSELSVTLEAPDDIILKAGDTIFISHDDYSYQGNIKVYIPNEFCLYTSDIGYVEQSLLIRLIVTGNYCSDDRETIELDYW